MRTLMRIALVTGAAAVAGLVGYFGGAAAGSVVALALSDAIDARRDDDD